MVASLHENYISEFLSLNKKEKVQTDQENHTERYMLEVEPNNYYLLVSYVISLLAVVATVVARMLSTLYIYVYLYIYLSSWPANGWKNAGEYVGNLIQTTGWS